MKFSYLSLLLLLIPYTSLAEEAQGSRDGELRHQTENWQAWDQAQEKWLSPEGFWRAYANRRGGLTWGEGATYPPYEQVKELDTFLVALPTGSCLMEFWHSRWRIANDVRRWDTRFNDLLGCPQVFD